MSNRQFYVSDLVDKMKMWIQQQRLNRLMHGAIRKVFHNPNDLIRNGCVKSHFVDCSSNHFADGLLQRFYSRLINDHRIAVVKITYLEVTAGNELQLERLCKIKIHIKLVPL